MRSFDGVGVEPLPLSFESEIATSALGVVVGSLLTLCVGLFDVLYSFGNHQNLFLDVDLAFLEGAGFHLYYYRNCRFKIVEPILFSSIL